MSSKTKAGISYRVNLSERFRGRTQPKLRQATSRHSCSMSGAPRSRGLYLKTARRDSPANPRIRTHRSRLHSVPVFGKERSSAAEKSHSIRSLYRKRGKVLRPLRLECEMWL